MPYLSEQQQFRRVLEGDIPAKEGLTSLFDRQNGFIGLPEGETLDYKVSLDPDSTASIGEFARDIMGFSNAHGGIVIIGVNNSHFAVGISKFDARTIRDALGPYLGTRVVYDLDTFELRIDGRRVMLAYALVPKTATNYPHLLRKDIVPPTSFIRKPKYVKGTLFFRSDDSVLSESPFGDVDGWARELGFSGAGPRTSSSFLISEDKPLLRLYSQINDRFFGRTKEIQKLIAEFDSAQGRGISIGGFGGLGKTELAINLVSLLYKRGKFKLIYSASAKQTVLGSTGIQIADPIFIDLKSFLLDFCGWLGVNVTSSASLDHLRDLSLAELAKHKADRILVFVDNLETVRDRALFDFLDNQLPSNCWIVATSRVHKLRKYLLPIELAPMDNDDAARLLRHELKRQGLSDLSGRHIEELREKANEVLNHPLAVRWYAWSCRKNPTQWNRNVSIVDLKQIEEFCVSSTLSSLGEDSQRALCSVLAIGSASESTLECIQHVAAVDDLEIEGVLWDLECSGMLVAATDENGVTTYSVSPMAQRLAADIARQKDWERDFVQRLRRYTSRKDGYSAETSLVRDLIAIRPPSIRSLDDSDREEIVKRVDRALASASATDRVRLLWRKAECERHLHHDITADDIYSECADSVLAKPELLPEEEKWHLLLEAATVARARSANRFQVGKSIRYLEAAERLQSDNTRVIGMLAELHGLLGDGAKVSAYIAKAETALTDEFPDSIYAVNLNAALTRARENLLRPLRR